MRDFKIPYFEYSTKKIYYQISGPESEKAIIFIHGSGGNSNLWKNQLNLNINSKLIALDLPSHANSDDWEKPNLDLYTKVVEKLIEVLKLKNVILAGHSLGGAITQHLYFQNPNKISGLILVGTGGRLRVNPIILETVKQDYKKYLNTLLIGAFSRRTDKKIINKAIEEASRVNASITYHDFFICDRFDVLDKVHEIIIPCLIIVGNDDNLTPVKYSEFFHKNLSLSELYIIQDAGHMVMVEKPEEVNTAIKNFMAQYFT